jgi:excinuclease UvrABC ATPase subunit
VGTITEIYDFLRLLYARAADAYSYNTNEKMVSYADVQIKELILKEFEDKKNSDSGAHRKIEKRTLPGTFRTNFKTRFCACQG